MLLQFKHEQEMAEAWRGAPVIQAAVPHTLHAPVDHGGACRYLSVRRPYLAKVQTIHYISIFTKKIFSYKKARQRI